MAGEPNDDRLESSLLLLLLLLLRNLLLTPGKEESTPTFPASAKVFFVGVMKEVFFVVGEYSLMRGGVVFFEVVSVLTSRFEVGESETFSLIEGGGGVLLSALARGKAEGTEEPLVEVAVLLMVAVLPPW